MDVWRLIKVGFWTILILAVVLVLGTAGTLYWAIKNPRPAWNVIEKLVMPSDLTVEWEKMDVQVQHPQWNTWDFDVNGAKVIIRKGSPMVEAPLDTVTARFTVRIFQPRPWLHVRDFQVQGGNRILVKAAAPDPEADRTRSPFEQIRSFMNIIDSASNYITIDNMGLKVPAIELASEKGEPTRVRAEIKKPLGKDHPTVTQFSSVVEAGDVKVALNGWLDAAHMTGEAPFLQLKVEASSKTWKTSTDISGKYNGKQGVFDGQVKLDYGDGPKKMNFNPKFQIALTEVEAALTLDGAITDIPGPVVKLDKLKAEIRLPFDKGYLWSERPAQFKVSAPVALFFVDKDMRPPLEKSCRCKIPEFLKFDIEGRAWFEPMLNDLPEKRTVLEAKMTGEGIDNKLFTASLAAHLRIEKQNAEWRLDPRIDSTIKLHSFQGFRQFLDARNVIIPAPLDILDGAVVISARNPVTNDDKMIRTLLEFSTDLASDTQKVVVSSTVNLDLSRDFKALDVYLHALLTDIKLELPPLDPVLGIPSLAKDPRVIMKPVKAKAESGFKMQVFFDVKTVNAGSVRLLSPLASPHVPMTIEVNTAAKGESTGFIRLEPFVVKYLRRELHIERMQVSLAEDENGSFPVGGRVRIDQSGYKIYVDIAGTTAAPSVQLNSDPYLPKSDIISVLLYGRTNDQLVGADAETAGSFEAAMADRAIGIFGLWAFASTPIQSFSYNAVTKVYTATVQLADGLTAGVGTNWERAAHLEVRKRVSRRWVLTASWSPTGDQEQVGKLVLQWEKRF